MINFFCIEIEKSNKKDVSKPFFIKQFGYLYILNSLKTTQHLNEVNS